MIQRHTQKVLVTFDKQSDGVYRWKKIEQELRWNPTTVNFKMCEMCIYRQKGSECFVVRDKAETTYSIQSEVEVSQKGIFCRGECSGFEVWDHSQHESRVNLKNKTESH